eukprot:TRINITY_DN35069_c0_g1_i1.p1 TRINITY_DN35069_c0_g1~~TRINITY_DN35069_c0_g1_i1.p1  ORF type:complete len:254 (+),score=17.66 TRINITY_DN35069_c0_g1_i1:38-799(+)
MASVECKPRVFALLLAAACIRVPSLCSRALSISSVVLRSPTGTPGWSSSHSGGFPKRGNHIATDTDSMRLTEAAVTRRKNTYCRKSKASLARQPFTRMSGIEGSKRNKLIMHAMTGHWCRFINAGRACLRTGMDPKGWTLLSVVQCLAAFTVAGFFEIAGGWFVWQALKEGRPRWWIMIGCSMLALYGFLPPTLQPPSPSSSFGRIYAAYGGIFIILSFAWGVMVDKLRLDVGDKIGGSVALLGVLIVWFWPR